MKHKMKCRKGLKQRLWVTRRGALRRLRAGRSHLMSTKSGKRVRQLRRPVLVEGEQAKVYLRMLLE